MLMANLHFPLLSPASCPAPDCRQDQGCRRVPDKGANIAPAAAECGEQPPASTRPGVTQAGAVGPVSNITCITFDTNIVDIYTETPAFEWTDTENKPS